MTLDIIPNWHPVFVHFTVALLTLAAVLFVGALMLPAQWRLREQCYVVARWNLWLGFGFALVTALAGWYAFNSVTHDAPSHAAMTEHRNWALATIAVYLPFVAWSVTRHRSAPDRRAGFALLLLLPTVLLAGTGYRGAELVYRFGLGVESLPGGEGRVDLREHGHTHVHGAPEAHGTNLPRRQGGAADDGHRTHEQDADRMTGQTRERVAAVGVTYAGSARYVRGVSSVAMAPYHGGPVERGVPKTVSTACARVHREEPDPVG